MAESLKTKSRLVFAVVIVGLFLFGSVAARLAGVWRSDIPLKDYRYYIQHLHEYDHARGQARQ